MNITALLPILNTIAIVIGLGLTLGAFVYALRGGYSQEARGIQKQVIEALTVQNEAQGRQIAAYEKEIARQRRILDTIKTLVPLKRRGLHIEINGETVTLVDDRSGRTHTVRIQTDDDEKEEL